MFLDNPDDDLDIIIIMHDAIIDASGGSKDYMTKSYFVQP